MPVAWTDLDSDDIGSGVRLTDALGQALEDNDEAACERVFQLDFAGLQGASVHPTFGVVFTRSSQWIPPWAKVLRLYFDVQMVLGGTGYCKATLGGSMDSNTFTDTVDQAVTLTFSDITSFRNSYRSLEIKTAKTGGGTAVQIDSIRYCTNRFSFD